MWYRSLQPDPGRSTPYQMERPRRAAYLIFMVACDLAAYLIGLITEREFGSYASLIVFLTLYFLGFWISWVLAVRVTEPKTPPTGGKSA